METPPKYIVKRTPVVTTPIICGQCEAVFDGKTQREARTRGWRISRYLSLCPACKPATRRNKFNAIKTQRDGIWFDSGHEADRYSELRILQLAGKITDLELQPEFPIVVNGKKICKYKADFRYKEAGGGAVVEDAKSSATRKLSSYRLKKKLVEAIYGIKVIEV